MYNNKNFVFENLTALEKKAFSNVVPFNILKLFQNYYIISYWITNASAHYLNDIVFILVKSVESSRVYFESESSQESYWRSKVAANLGEPLR